MEVDVARTGEPVTEESGRSRTSFLVVAAVGAVLAVVGTVLWVVPAGASHELDADRKQVTARADDFAVAYNTYDVADLADYQKRMRSLLTEEYDEQFREVTDAIFEALQDKKQTSGDAKVLGTAVQSIDADTAEVIVAVDAKITNTDNEAAVPRRFRWKLTLDKTDGEWLVSGFESVASVSATTGPAPGADGTDEGSEQ